MTNILLIGGLKSHPAITGGHVHTVSFARALSHLGYNVRMYGMAGRREHYGKGHSSLLVEVLSDRLAEYTSLSLKTGILQNVFRKLGLPHVWQYFLLSRAQIPDSLSESIEWADAIIYNRAYCPPAPGTWCHKPKYMLSHNLEYRLLELGNWPERMFINWMKRVEKKATDRYDDIFVCADDDRNFFKAQDPAMSLPRVNTGVHESDYKFSQQVRYETRRSIGVEDNEILVLFTGSNFTPNIEALNCLCEYSDKDQLWLRQNKIKIVVAGSISKERYTKGVLTVTGRVPEISPYLAAADVGLNPVTSGSGTNVKLFEYLAAKLPILSTQFGVRGSSLVAGDDFIEYDSKNPRAAFQWLVSSPIESWREFALLVWARHQDSCDMDRIVKRAVSVAKRFPKC